MITMKKVLAFFFCFAVCCSYSKAQVANEDKHRLIVTTDLGGTDPDDVQSMIHLLLCSNVIDIEGLISSQVWMDDPDKTAKISEVVEQFGEVLPRLNKHAEGYPGLNQLRAIIKQGQTVSNMTGVGSGKDSPGSELIISVVDKKKDQRPVWLAAWGGMNTVAQALWKVKHTRSEKAFKKFISKIRIYDVLGQDDAGAWIAKNFPEIIYIRNREVYGWGPSDQWIKENIQSCLPFGKHYPNRVWAGEGDSPSFLFPIHLNMVVGEVAFPIKRQAVYEVWILSYAVEKMKRNMIPIICMEAVKRVTPLSTNGDTIFGIISQRVCCGLRPMIIKR